jgi:deoxycytidylate deaminase
MDDYIRNMSLNRLGISKHMQKIRDIMLEELLSSDISSDISDDSNSSSDMKFDSCYNSSLCSMFTPIGKNTSDDFIKSHSYCTLSGNSHHFSIIFQGNLSDKTPIKKVLSKGENKFINNRSIHAEIDAIYKLNNSFKNKKQKFKHNNESVNMLVIKVKRDGTISNSAPCINCLKKMTECPIGYHINKIYYSTNDKNIECDKLIDLINTDQLHVSSYYRNTNYNMNKWYQWRSKLNCSEKHSQYL